MTRTFIALELNAQLQHHLEGVIHQVAQLVPSVRFVDPAGIHLTIAFLGELTDEQVADALAVTTHVAAQFRPFSYRLTRLGIFGSPRSPRVIWMGIDEPTRTLAQLHHMLNHTLSARGFSVDTRPFAPHITLARLTALLAAAELTQLQQLLASAQRSLISTHVYPVAHLDILKSELRKSGSHYTILHSCALAAADNV